MVESKVLQPKPRSSAGVPAGREVLRGRSVTYGNASHLFPIRLWPRRKMATARGAERVWRELWPGRGLSFRVVMGSILLALFIGETLIALVGAITSARDVAAAGHAARSEPIIGAANDLQRLVIDLETVPAEALITGDRTSLRPSADAHGRLDRQAARLQRPSPVTKGDERSTDAARRDVMWAGCGIAGSVLLILVFGRYLVRDVTRPIRCAPTVGHGDRAVPMPKSGQNKIGSLGRSLNTVARSLGRNHGDLNRIADEQAALRRVAMLVAHGGRPSEVFDAVAREVGCLLKCDYTAIQHYETGGSAPVVGSWYRHGVLTRPPPLGHRIRTPIESPITVDGRLWGVVVALRSEPTPRAGDAEVQMRLFASLLATAILSFESRAELTAARARVVAAGDAARRRIERDLHDGTQQRLIALALKLRMTEADVSAEDQRLKGQLSESARDLMNIIDDLRDISQGIHPMILSRGGLTAAIETLIRGYVIPVELTVNVHHQLSEPVEVALYYTVSEALTNVIKHANASVLWIDLSTQDDLIHLMIRDDGVGGAEAGRGSGLVGLSDRVEALGGTIQVTSPAGAGTTLLARIPIKAV